MDEKIILRRKLAAAALSGIARRIADSGYAVNRDDPEVKWAAQMAVALADATIEALEARR